MPGRTELRNLDNKTPAELASLIRSLDGKLRHRNRLLAQQQWVIVNKYIKYDKDYKEVRNHDLLGALPEVTTEYDPEHASKMDCPVCLDAYMSNTDHQCLGLSCGHQLCRTCALKMRENGMNKCPTCRAKIRGYLMLYL